MGLMRRMGLRNYVSCLPDWKKTNGNVIVGKWNLEFRDWQICEIFAATPQNLGGEFGRRVLLWNK